MKTRPTPEKKADPRDELIRQRAYEQYEKRGKQKVMKPMIGCRPNKRCSQQKPQKLAALAR